MSIQRTRSVNENGVVTAVKIDKPGMLNEELGKIIVKDSYRYMLTGLIHCASRNSISYTTFEWKCIEPADNTIFVLVSATKD